MYDDDSCAVYITVFIEQDSFTLFKIANETVMLKRAGCVPNGSS